MANTTVEGTTSAWFARGKLAHGLYSIQTNFLKGRIHLYNLIRKANRSWLPVF